MAISKATQAVIDRAGSLTDMQTREIAKHNFENPNQQLGNIGTTFKDPVRGFLDFAKSKTPGTVEFNLLRPGVDIEIQKAFDIFKQKVGFDIGQVTTGDPITSIESAIRGGKSAEEFASTFNFETFRKFGRETPGSRTAEGQTPVPKAAETVEQIMARTGQTRQDIMHEGFAQGAAETFQEQQETALSSTLDIAPGEFETGQVSQEAFDLTGLFGEGDTADQLSGVLGVGLGTVNNALMSFFQKQQDLAQQQRQALEDRQAQFEQGFTDLLETSSQQQLQQTLEANKIQEKMDAMSDIQEQMLKKQEALNLGIQAEEERIAPLTILGRRKQKLRDQVANELSALNVAAQVIQGDLSFALTMADMSFNALQVDRQNQLSAYEFMLQMNRQDLISLKQNEKDAINSQLGLIESAMNQAEANKDRIFELITKNENFARAAALAGIGLTDDPVEALEKMQPFLEVEGVDATTDFKNYQLAGGQAGTGKTFAEWLGKGPPVPSEFITERAQRTVASVDNLISQVSGWTVGFGSLLKFIPETQAANFDAELKTLKANIAFGELTAMREASKTGGALGQVSNIELGLLESALGALDTKQSAENFKKNLEQIKSSIQNWQSAVSASNDTGAGEFSW